MRASINWSDGDVNRNILGCCAIYVLNSIITTFCANGTPASRTKCTSSSPLLLQHTPLSAEARAGWIGARRVHERFAVSAQYPPPAGSLRPAICFDSVICPRIGRDG